MADIC